MNFMERMLPNIGQGARRGDKKYDFFKVPALEPAYMFKVTVYYSYRSTRRRWSGQAFIQRETAEVYELTRRTIRQCARTYSVFNPAGAEDAANAALAKALADAAHPAGRVSLDWTARAEVWLPEEVAEMVRKALRDEYMVQARARVSRLVLDKTNDLRVRWDGFLNEAAMSRNAQHAVRLAEDPREVALVLEDVLRERREGAEQLMSLINKIIDAQKAADVFDLVVKSETVLRKTLERMGIALPEADAGTLLEPLETDG
jgi:hypothetical protein